MLPKITVRGMLAKLTNDFHVPIAVGVFAVTSFYHFKTGHDLGSGYVSSLYAFYGFLAGHFGCSQVWPDKPDGGDGQATADAAGHIRS